MTQKFGCKIFHACLGVCELYCADGQVFIFRERLILLYFSSLVIFGLAVSILLAKHELYTIFTIILNIFDCVFMNWSTVMCTYLISVVSDNKI